MIKIDDLLHLNESELYDWLTENFDKFDLRPKPIEVDSPEDIHIKGQEILVWDGCEWTIDFVEHCADSGVDYMANNTEVVAFLPLPEDFE